MCCDLDFNAEFHFSPDLMQKLMFILVCSQIVSDFKDLKLIKFGLKSKDVQIVLVLILEKKLIKNTLSCNFF